MLRFIIPLWCCAAACAPGEPTGLAVLGGGSDDVANVDLQVVATAEDGLDAPQDLAFDPEHPGRLWVVNRGDDSVTIVFDAGTEAQASEHRVDPFAEHFMDEVSSISFGAPGTFGTCQDSRNTYNGTEEPNDYMGPTLWSSDLEIFAKSNPAAVDYLTELHGTPTDLGSHIDMQHETPSCTGIAWEGDNVYWTVDGQAGSIDRVDFGVDHGAGYDDHSDGIILEYVTGEIGYLEGVPGHLQFDADSAILSIADPANGSIVQLDTTTGRRDQLFFPKDSGTWRYSMADAVLTELVGTSAGLTHPSGVARAGDVLFVTDNADGWIYAFDAVTGEEIDRLDSGRGAGTLRGLVAVSLDELWLVDAETDEVLRITPLAGSD
jgi:hypothetical protein